MWRGSKCVMIHVCGGLTSVSGLEELYGDAEKGWVMVYPAKLFRSTFFQTGKKSWSF